MSIEIKDGKHQGELGVLEGDIHYYDKEGKEQVSPLVRCTECGWGGTQSDCGFGHNDFYCPDCGKESIKIVEPKVLGGKQ